MRRERATAGANTVVQVIHVTWDKTARGAPGAARRNRLPSAVPLPKSLAPEIGRHLLIHESHWGHANDFESEMRSVVKVLDTAAGYSFACAYLRAVEEGVELRWTWSNLCGLPRRSTRTEEGKAIPASHTQIAREGQWVRTRWNGRFACMDTGTWWYELVVMNVGVCPSGDVPADFFMRSPPVDDYSQMAMLR